MTPSLSRDEYVHPLVIEYATGKQRSIRIQEYASFLHAIAPFFDGVISNHEDLDLLIPILNPSLDVVNALTTLHAGVLSVVNSSSAALDLGARVVSDTATVAYGIDTSFGEIEKFFPRKKQELDGTAQVTAVFQDETKQADQVVDEPPSEEEGAASTNPLLSTSENDYQPVNYEPTPTYSSTQEWVDAKFGAGSYDILVNANFDNKTILDARGGCGGCLLAITYFLKEMRDSGKISSDESNGSQMGKIA